MVRACLLWVAVLAPALGQAADAGALRARHAALSERLASNPFGRPLHVESGDGAGGHQGDVYAVMPEPYAVVAPALARPDSWCEILMLQVNAKRCEAPGAGAAPTVTAFITRKPRDPVEKAYEVRFRYMLAAAAEDYIRVALTAREGPVGTRNYRIRVEAAPLDGKRTFLHLSYAYELGLMARLAVDAYLATSGRDKVGFSVVDSGPDGRPVHVDGVRGLIERGAMRHYLAIEAFLDSLDEPRPRRLEARLRDWYADIDRYPQLREPIGEQEYLEMKRGAAAGVTSGDGA
jgi:hypothetical protein